MYGQYVRSDGIRGTSRPFADATDFQNLRNNLYISHIKTFRAGLYHGIAEQEQSIMFPIAKKAGFDRVRFSDRVLYIRNLNGSPAERAMDEVIATENLLSAKVALDSVKKHFWLTDGTLLGYCRENDFISFDLDIDLGMFIEDDSPEIIEAFLKNGWSHLKTYGTRELGLEYTFSRGGISLDIFFFYPEKDHFWCAGWLNGGTDLKRDRIRYKYPSLSFEKINFKGATFNVPAHTETYLSWIYGKEWQIPDRNWDWAYSPRNRIEEQPSETQC